MPLVCVLLACNEGRIGVSIEPPWQNSLVLRLLVGFIFESAASQSDDDLSRTYLLDVGLGQDEFV